MPQTVVIKVQSISDIITNSSSEVFCTITGKDMESIFEILYPLFKGQDSEFEPTISYFETENPPYIEINMPYGFDSVTTFYKAGLKAFLDLAIGENNYSIDYDF